MWHHSRTACVVLFRVASASLQSGPARLFKTHLNKARSLIFHIQCSGIFTGEWGGLNCCWCPKQEILIYAGQNLAPPFQCGLHLKRRTQHSLPAPGSRCSSHPFLTVYQAETQVLLASFFPFLCPILYWKSTKLMKMEEQSL